MSPRVPSRRSERNDRDQRRTLSVDARSFVPNTGSSDPNPNGHLTPHQQQLGERLYPKVFFILIKITLCINAINKLIFLIFYLGSSNQT